MPPRRATRLRRVPTQERSKKRLEAILEAAAVEFAAAGFDAVTMEAVAARAGTSIGSVYVFFPNKLALFEALAQETLVRSDAAFEGVARAAAENRPWTEVVDLAVDVFASFHSDPTFRAIWMNMQLYGVYAKADAAMNRSFIERSELLVARHTGLDGPKRRLVAAMIVHSINALLYVAARSKPEARAAMVAETKVMLRRYLAPYARSRPAPGS